MPERFQVALKRMAWAASRLTRRIPPKSQPPGKGKPPAQSYSLLKLKICKGTQTYRERKYWLTTVQIPASLWARVPTNTRKNDNPNNTTVMRREAMGVRILTQVGTCFLGAGNVAFTVTRVTGARTAA